MRETLDVHVAIDRRVALASGVELPGELVGSILFADIAGFTRLTGDLLASAGDRRGAEELTAALDRIYTTLIAPVHEYGGSVITFSGDAITCVFPGDDGRASATAAMAMHTAVAKIRVAIAAEQRPVRIKIGLAHGQIYRSAPGDEAMQRIDTLAGAPVLDAAAAERQANPGETVLAPSLRSLAGARLGETRQHGNAVLLDVVPPALPKPWSEPPPLPHSLTAPFTLAPLRSEIDHGRAAYLAELRTIVPIFARFDGLRFGSDHDASERLDAYVRWVQSVLAGFGGTLIGLTIGDKGSYFNGAFGALRANEDDAARALAAATALLSPPSSLAWVRNIGIGVCRGRMRVGTFGGAMRRTYAVLGSYGNLAARLMERAAPGQILVDSSILEAAGHSHRFRPIGELELKGRDTPIEVHSCVGRALVRSRLDEAVDEETSMVGRREHVLAFEDALGDEGRDEAFFTPSARTRTVLGSASARSDTLASLGPKVRPEGWGRALLVVGEAGIGKTRVLETLAKRAKAKGRPVIRVCGEAIEQTTAYHGFRSALYEVLDLDHLPTCESLPGGEDDRHAHVRERVAGSRFARFAPLLGPILPFAFPDDDVTKPLVGEARADTARELMTSLLLPDHSGPPPVILVDDAHYLDASSWALLARVRAERDDLVVVVCTRPFEEGRTPREWQRLLDSQSSVPMPLGPLSREEIAELTARRAQAREVDELIVEFMVERAGGHPFFIEQLLRAMLELGHAELVGDRCVARATRETLERADFPATIEGVIISRLDRIPSEQLLVVKIASVLGRSFEAEAVAALHPDTPEPESLQSVFAGLCARDLLVDEGGQTFAFRHAILQRVAYELMLFAQRRELHGKAAAFIEAMYGDELATVFPRLAHHFREAEEFERAVAYLDRAAEHAVRQGAYDEAIRFVRSLFELDPDAVLAGDPERRARRLAILGDAELNLGAIKESRKSLEGALTRLGRPVPRKVAAVVGRAMVEAGVQLVHRLAPRLFVRTAGDAERRAFASQILRDLQPVYFLHNALEHMLFATLRAVNLAEAARGHNIAEQARAEGYAAVALIASAIGAERIALSYRARAVQTGDELGDPTSLGQVWLLLALHSIGIGECQRALGEARRARELFVEGSHRRRFEIACGTIGWASGYMGKFEDGLAAWTDVRKAGLQRGDRHSVAQGYAGVAEQLLSRGRPEDLSEADAAIVRAIENTSLGQDRMFDVHAMGLRAATRARQAQLDAALEDFDLAITATEGTVPLSGYCVAAYSRPADGLLDLVESGSLDAKAPIVRRGVRSIDRYASAFRVGKPRSLRAQGRLAAALGNPRGAKRALVASARIADKLGLPVDKALAELDLARLDSANLDALADATARLRALGLSHEPTHAERVTGPR